MTFAELPIPEGYERILSGTMERDDLLGWNNIDIRSSQSHRPDGWYIVGNWEGKEIQSHQIILRRIKEDNNDPAPEEYN